MEAQPGKIYGQIQKVMQELDAIGKDRKNEQQGFKFRGIEDVYNELHPRLAKHGIFSAPEVLENKREERPTKSGGMMTYSIMRICYRFYADDGSSFQCVVIGEGSDSGDKSSNKAMAVAHKYALTQVFTIPTQDMEDPDQTSHEVASKPPTGGATMASVTVSAPGMGVPPPCAGCGSDLKFSENKSAWYCPNFADKARKHSYIPRLDAAR